MTRRYKAEEYPIWIKQVGNYLWGYNFDFKIHHHEKIRTGQSDEKLLQMVSLIATLQHKIAEYLEFLDRNQKQHPVPLSSEKFISPQVKDLISLKEACELLGEAPHTVRRMGDDGVFSMTRTRKGHRRFFRSEIESYRLNQGVVFANKSIKE